MDLQKRRGFTAIFIAIAFISGSIIGGIINYWIVSPQINDLRDQTNFLREQIDNLQSFQKPFQNITYLLGNNASLSKLYEEVRDSVVLIRGLVVQYTFFYPSYAEVQGSGFVYNFTGRMVIITNYHVVHNAANITVTFRNGNSYLAIPLGSDPYADLAVVSADAPRSEFKPLPIASSSTLEVGDPVIAIGNPFGLEGSMTTGIVSQLGRTIRESLAGNFPIANIIQTSAPINPGNSGGPLLNYLGQVVGITTAIVANSQGLAFAIPSNTILRELPALVTTCSYDQHPWLGVAGTDMTYEIARKMNTNITYGWLIEEVISGGPADKAGLQAKDIIIAIDENRIINGDDLSTYLEEYTMPGQTIDVTIVRNDQTIVIPVELGKRPPS